MLCIVSRLRLFCTGSGVIVLLCELKYLPVPVRVGVKTTLTVCTVLLV